MRYIYQNNYYRLSGCLCAGLMCAFLLSQSVVNVAHAQQARPGLKGKEDRPYDAQLLRLSELLGAVHYLRELCGAGEGQLWREQMRDLVEAEGTSAVRRVKLVNSFNKGYRGYRRTYRSCTQSAKLAVTRSMAEGASIAKAISKVNK